LPFDQSSSGIGMIPMSIREVISTSFLIGTLFLGLTQ